ncbi:MAG: hypothetical protein AAB916_03020 [Patescibacteria group bacterium]
MLTIVLWVGLLGGWLMYGRPFLAVLGNHITNGVPQVWRAAMANRYSLAARRGISFALVFTIIGIVLGLWSARNNTEAGQIIIYVSFVVSFLIVKVIASLISVFASALVKLLPVGEQTEEAMQDIRAGLKKRVDVALAFHIFTALSFVTLGVFVPIGIDAIVVLAIIAYYQVSDAYDVPVTWAPSFMMGVSITEAIVLVILSGLSVLPMTRPYVNAVGIDPLRFVHRGVVDASGFEAAQADRRAKLKQICGAEIGALQKSINAIDPTKEETDVKTGIKSQVVDPKARENYTRYTRELEEKKKSCFF